VLLLSQSCRDERWCAGYTLDARITRTKQDRFLAHFEVRQTYGRALRLFPRLSSWSEGEEKGQPAGA